MPNDIQSPDGVVLKCEGDVIEKRRGIPPYRPPVEIEADAIEIVTA